MIGHQHPFDVTRAANELLHGNKKDVSRAYRRFLQQTLSVPLGGKPLIVQTYCSQNDFSSVQVQAIYAYALAIQKAYAKDEPEGLVRCLGVHLEDITDTVGTCYEVSVDLSSASLRQLKALTVFVRELAYSMHAFCVNPGEAAGFEDYTYRGHPCSIASDESLWLVSGHDMRGSSGVLEWCYDEADARAIFASLSRFPERFKDLTIMPWASYSGKEFTRDANLAA